MTKQYDDFRRVKPQAADSMAWVNERISRQHRHWGYNLPAFDLDFCLVEMHGGKPAALVEYKYMSMCGKVDTTVPTFRALRCLADAAAVPLLLVFYDFRPHWWFAVTPLNTPAYRLLGRIDTQAMSERAYVELLYRARGIVCPPRLAQSLATYTQVVP